MEKNKWCNLPHDLGSIISNQLGLIDLLSFRGVCSFWRFSSSNASAEIKSFLPWFLLYGESAQCFTLNIDNKMYKIDIPEMLESTCLASFGGWLLLYFKNNNLLFFFCPFSRAKIEIPQCPLFSELQSEPYLYAAFSSYPTNPDCTIVVAANIKNEKDVTMRLCMLRRGESEWTFHEHIVPEFGKIKSIALHGRAFHILDDNKVLVAFECDTMTWTDYYYIITSRDSINVSTPTNKSLDYRVHKDWVYKKSFSFMYDEIKKFAGIDVDGPCSLLICGAMVLVSDTNKYHVISHGFLEDDDKGSNKPRRELKGVWLQPRFHQISEGQRW